MYDKDYVPYTAKRWREIPAVVVTGETKFTPEQEAAAHEELMGLIKKSEEFWAEKKAGIPADGGL